MNIQILNPIWEGQCQWQRPLHDSYCETLAQMSQSHPAQIISQVGFSICIFVGPDPICALTIHAWDMLTSHFVVCWTVDLPCFRGPTKSLLDLTPAGPLVQGYDDKLGIVARSSPLQEANHRVVNFSRRRRNVSSKAAKYAFLVPTLTVCFSLFAFWSFDSHTSLKPV